MIRIIAAAAVVTATMSCGSTLRESDSQAGAGGHAAASASAAPTAGRPVGSPAPDWVRITDDHGGWSIDTPKEWFDQQVTPFGYGAHGISSYDPATTSIPLKTGMSVSVQLMWDWNGDATDLRTFAERRVWTATCVACRRVLDTRRVALAGQDADFYVVEQNQPTPFDALEPRLFWLLRSPYFADRVLVIQAVPGASPLRPTVERMVNTLQLFRPTPPDLTPTKTRQQVIDEIRRGVSLPPMSAGAINGIEAKLMRWQDWEIAHNAALRATSAVSGGPSAVHGGIDPDVVVWVVAMSGTFDAPQKGPGPPGLNATPAPTPAQRHWRISVVPAREPYSWGGPSMGGPEMTWPIWFEQLIDRDR